MKDSVNGLHGEGLLDLNNEKVDHFLIGLQQVDRIVALADQDLAVLAGQEFDVLFMDEGGVSEFEGAVYKRNVVGVVLWQHLLLYLDISEDFVSCLFAVDLEGFETRIGEVFLEALRNS